MRAKCTERKKLTRSQYRFIFFLAIVIIPLIQFAIFYVYKNINSIILAFQNYEAKAGTTGYDITFAGFANFSVAFQTIGNSWFMIKNSLLLFLFNGIFGLILSMLFSFYVYKEYVGSKLFNFLLFLPNILSTLVVGLLYKYIVGQEVLGSIFGLELGLLDNPDTAMGAIIFYNIFVGFGINSLMFTGAMNGINESVVESAQLDGVNKLQEFLHISVPLIFPTFVSFVIINISGIFTNQMNLLTLYGAQSGQQYSSLGFYMYLQAQESGLIRKDSAHLNYAELSALSLIVTVVVLTLSVTVKKLLNKFGPSVD